MPDFKNYDPGQLVFTFAGLPISGFADGTMIKCTRKTDTFSINVGTQGDVARVRSQDKSGEVTITLQGVSPSNDILSAIMVADEQLGLSYGALMVKDLQGTTIITASVSWLKKPADVEFGKDLPTREWTFECASLSMLIGGTIL